MTQTERERCAASLYSVISSAKIELEAEMDTLIEKGPTKNLSAAMLDIMELSAKFLREKPTLQ